MGIRAWVRGVWRNLLHKRSVEAGLRDEIRGYVEMLADEKVAAGVPVERARREALMETGGEAQVKQAVREKRAGAGFEVLLQDVRFAFRTLGKDRSFTLVAVLILGLGFGANVAVFSVVNTMLLRPLPFRDPQRLVWMEGNNGIGSPADVTYRVDAFQEFQRNNRSFATVTAFVPFYNLSETRLKGNDELKPIEGVWVAGDFFETLGVHPMLGRLFTPDEAVNYNKGGRPAVILSYAFWQRQFNADPAIVGKLITINNRATPVVGVLGPDFDFGAVFAPGTKMDYFVPIIMDSIASWGHMLCRGGKAEAGSDAGAGAGRVECAVSQVESRGSSELGYGLQDGVDGAEGACERIDAAAAGDFVVRGRDDPADRVREPFESAAGAGCGAEQGVCAAYFAGRGPWAAGAATADGEPGAVGYGRGTRTGHCVCGDALSGAAGIGRVAVVEHSADRWRGAGMDGADCGDGWIGVWAGAGDSGFKRECAGAVEGWWAHGEWRQEA